MDQENTTLEGQDPGQGSEGAPPVDKEPTLEELKALLAQNTSALKNAEAAALASRKEAEGAQAMTAQILQTIQTAAANRDAAGRGGAPADTRTLAERIAEDPEGVLDEHFRTRMAPLYQGYLDNQDAQNRELARERISHDDSLKDANGVSYWDKYGDEIGQFMQGMPMEVKARPGSYERALRFVLANHLDEVADDRAQRLAKQREARERGSFTEGPSGAAPRARVPEGMSPVEKEIAKGLGFTDQQWLEAKRMNQFGQTGGS